MSYSKDRTRVAIYNYFRFRTNVTNDELRNRFQVQRYMTGNVNPRYRDQIAKHQNATTVMSGTYESVFSQPSKMGETLTNVNLPEQVERRSITGHETAARYLPLTDTHPNASIDPSGARSQAMSKALKQIKKSYTSMSGSVFLGELGEAIHMLRHPAEGLRKALKETYLDRLKKMKRQDPNRWKKAISQTWLESSFGWRPFINDLEDAVQAYEDIRKRKEDTYAHIRAVGKDRKHIAADTEYYAPLASTVFKGSYKTYDEAVVIIRGEVKSKAVTTAADKARVFGLSPAEFLPTAWELLPWSFLADYFTNIGDIVENSITDTSDVAWLEMATITKRITEARSGGDYKTNYDNHGKGDPKWSFVTLPGYLKYERKVMSRTGDVTLKVPPLMFELPGSPLKGANMLSLWTQANTINPQDPRRLRGRTFR